MSQKEPMTNKDVLAELHSMVDQTERAVNAPLPAAFTADARKDYFAKMKKRVVALRAAIELYEALEGGRVTLMVVPK